MGTYLRQARLEMGSCPHTGELCLCQAHETSAAPPASSPQQTVCVCVCVCVRARVFLHMVVLPFTGTRDKNSCWRLR